jgi:CDP-glucose 4,6-dehydratase
VLVITSDKVYADDGTGRPHDEDDRLGGRDPYSASKAMTELAVASYARSFFDPRGVVVATARGGNVIGGGDFAADRILPDAWRAVRAGEPLVLRNPDAVRPWQHVLDCVAAYLVYAEQLAAKPDAPRTLNFGPDDEGVRVEELARVFLRELGAEAAIRVEPNPAAVETHHLALDTRAADRALGWRGRLSALDAATWTAEWYRRVDEGEDALAVTREQIGRHAEL